MRTIDYDMNKALKDDDRISYYLQGQMSQEEESDFLADLETDAELRQNAIIQARLIKGMKQVDEELVCAFKQASSSDIHLLVNKPLRHSLFFKWASVAASIVIVMLGGYKGYDYYDTTRLGAEYANTFPISTIIQRGDSDIEIEQELTDLFNNVINRKDLSQTTNRLAELWEISKQDTYNDYTDYAPYIGWYLAIGYLEDYEKDKAKKVLADMINYDPNMLNQEVEGLFNSI